MHNDECRECVSHSDVPTDNNDVSAISANERPIHPGHTSAPHSTNRSPIYPGHVPALYSAEKAPRYKHQRAQHKHVKIKVDSGAMVSVPPPSTFSDFATTPTYESEVGISYTSACGTTIPDQGLKQPPTPTAPFERQTENTQHRCIMGSAKDFSH